MMRGDASPRGVIIEAGEVRLRGDLAVPMDARALVMFVHGSGSSRLSTRNIAVAEGLGRAGLATLLFDLLTPDEEDIDAVTRHLRFDIGLLAARTVAATDWVLSEQVEGSRRIGYFGASTGAAAALIAAAERPSTTCAVVSRGGRPDLAADALPRVTAPTLLVVGGRDDVVLGLNESALAQLSAAREKRLVTIPGATHLFPEPGALDEVTRLATDWFVSHSTL